MNWKKLVGMLILTVGIVLLGIFIYKLSTDRYFLAGVSLYASLIHAIMLVVLINPLFWMFFFLPHSFFI